MVGCRIEPPLKLADAGNVYLKIAEVETNIDVLWEIDPHWRDNWWYGWDDDDIAQMGSLEYPEPSNYEVRLYYLGSLPSQPHQSVDRGTVFGKSFRRRLPVGYHDMLLWSNIDSPDGTQSLVVDESDMANIQATTSRSRLSYAPPVSRASDVYNDPDIFYAGRLKDFYISDDPDDYDYFDESTQTYVKVLDTTLTPLVYTYLVQVVIYNNNGRVIGPADRSTISALADGVSLHTGVTSSRDIIVAYDMRFKKSLPARQGRQADIVGGKMRTFGLCEMEPWARARGARYAGGRSELRNKLMVDLAFNNARDSVYAYDITEQMQRQAHGGVITIEIDADTLRIPVDKRGPGSTFDPTIAPGDTIEYNYGM